MHFSCPSCFLFVLASLVAVGLGLRTVPLSPCAEVCGDSTNTTSSEIVCNDSAYRTPTGQVFAQCITCQLNSTASDSKTGDSDLKWLLYNLRYAISTCLYGFPDDSYTQSTPCVTSRACGPFEGNIKYNDLTPNATAYEYCPNMPAQDAEDRCSNCLRQLGPNHFIANYFTAITAACALQVGSLLHLDDSIFADGYINVTKEEAGPKTYDVDGEEDGPFGLGTKIGIAVGAICLTLALFGITVVVCGKRRRRRVLQDRQRRSGQIYTVEDFTRARQQPRLDTKWAAGTTLTGDSPISVFGQEHKFSPYSSQYNSPISARDQQIVRSWEWPLNKEPIVYEDVQGESFFEMTKTRQQVGQMEIYVEAPRKSSLEMPGDLLDDAASRGFTVSPRTPAVVKMQFPSPPVQTYTTKNRRWFK